MPVTFVLFSNNSLIVQDPSDTEHIKEVIEYEIGPFHLLDAH
jgi:hypothetical protein